MGGRLPQCRAVTSRLPSERHQIGGRLVTCAVVHLGDLRKEDPLFQAGWRDIVRAPAAAATWAATGGGLHSVWNRALALWGAAAAGARRPTEVVDIGFESIVVVTSKGNVETVWEAYSFGWLERSWIANLGSKIARVTYQRRPEGTRACDDLRAGANTL